MFGVDTGVAYPDITRRALCKFNAEMKTFMEEHAKPLDLNRNIRKKNQHITDVYNSDRGMVPQYGGHVPGNLHESVPILRKISKTTLCHNTAWPRPAQLTF